MKIVAIIIAFLGIVGIGFYSRYDGMDRASKSTERHIGEVTIERTGPDPRDSELWLAYWNHGYRAGWDSCRNWIAHINDSLSFRYHFIVAIYSDSLGNPDSMVVDTSKCKLKMIGNKP